MALNYEDVERMKEENKAMRLELQRLRMIAASDIGSAYGGGESSPRSNIGGSFPNMSIVKRIRRDTEDTSSI